MEFKQGINVLTQKDCPHCKTYKKEYKTEIDDGTMNEVKLDKIKETDEKMWSIISGLELDGVPSLVVKNKDDYCSLDIMSHEKLKCVNSKELKDEMDTSSSHSPPIQKKAKLSPVDLITNFVKL